MNSNDDSQPNQDNSPESLPESQTAARGQGKSGGKLSLSLALLALLIAIAALAWPLIHQEQQDWQLLNEGMSTLLNEQKQVGQQQLQLSQDLENTKQAVEQLSRLEQQIDQLQQNKDSLQQQLANQRSSQQNLQQEQIQRLSEQQFQIAQLQDQQQSQQMGLQHLQRQFEDQQGLNGLLQQNRQLIWAEYQQLARQYANLIDTLALQGFEQQALGHYRQLLQVLAPFEMQDSRTYSALQQDKRQLERQSQRLRALNWQQLGSWLAQQDPLVISPPKQTSLPQGFDWSSWQQWLGSLVRFEQRSQEQLSWQLSSDLALWQMQQQVQLAKVQWQLGQSQPALALLDIPVEVQIAALGSKQTQWQELIRPVIQELEQGVQTQASTLLAQWGND